MAKEEENSSFRPELINASHIIQAAQKIKSGEVSVKPSTIYDVIIDGERFSPKGVMKIAHRLATGADIWQLTGGKATNSILEKLGFDVMTKSSDFTLRRNYWKIAPAENASRWDEFYEKGIMAVSFKRNGSGDLRKYKTFKELEVAINRSNSNEAMSLWTCCHAPIGDIVFANKGRNTVVGIGVIEGPYEYDENADFPHIRKVKWLANKTWNYTPGQFASEKRPRPSLFRIDTLSKTEVGPEILKAYLEQFPEYEQEFTDNNIWPVYEEATYEKLVAKVAGFKNSDIVDRYFDFLDQIMENSNVNENDERLFLSTPKNWNMISMTYNQRYITFLNRDKDGIHCFVMIERGKEPESKSLNILESGSFGGKFAHIPPLLDFIKFRMVDGSEFTQELAQLVADAMKKEMNRETKYYLRHIHKNSHNQLIYNAATDEEFREKLLSDAYEHYFETESDEESDDLEQPELKTLNTNMTLNTILFGPPGTGKTYHSINAALTAIGEDIEGLSRKEMKAKYDELHKEGRIMFTTFHQSMSYEDFIEGIKPLEPKRGEPVQFDIIDGIFKLISERAQSNWSNSLSSNTGKLSFEDAFEKLQDDWDDNRNMKFSMKTKGKEYIITGFKNKSIEFKKASGGEGHTLSISTLRDIYYGTREMWYNGVGVYYPGIIEALNKYKGSSEKVALKNYVLIIDEINRGNVSQIFGELITLIEEDKRLGSAESIKVTLPYSKADFGVPPNLYIIGTMNTADRSVEALDTALRRRFSFMEMAPRYDLLELNAEFAGETLGNILATINKRIEKLLDKDHLIGHSYFIEVGNNMTTLKAVFRNKFLPLLQEYFFGDFSKIGLVLGEGFFEEANESDDDIFANFRDVDISEHSSRIIYRLKDPGNMSDDEFEEALHLLMRK